MRAARLAALRAEIAHLETAGAPSAPGPVPLGVSAIDACLSKGGLSRAALHEVAPADYRAYPAACGFLLALAGRFLADSAGAVLWPRLAHEAYRFGAPYGPGLAALGLNPGRMLDVRCRAPRDLLWTLEEGVKTGGLGLVLGERPARMSLFASLRLQRAARERGTPILLLRAPGDETPSAAATRWRIAPAAGPLSWRWQVALERIRHGRPGVWLIEWNHDTRCFHPSPILADRALSFEAPPARGYA